LKHYFCILPVKVADKLFNLVLAYRFLLADEGVTLNNIPLFP